jgi:hypothetical protein
MERAAEIPDQHCSRVTRWSCESSGSARALPSRAGSAGGVTLIDLIAFTGQ